MKEKRNKVVYNSCFGGFSLSDKAVIWLEQNAEDEELREFIKVKREEASKIPAKERWTSSVEDIMQSSLRYDFKEHGIPRHHPDLIKVVEKLKDKADGMCAELRIAKIKGCLYRIDEYDGAETVIEPEDYDWIDIND